MTRSQRWEEYFNFMLLVPKFGTKEAYFFLEKIQVFNKCNWIVKSMQWAFLGDKYRMYDFFKKNLKTDTVKTNQLPSSPYTVWTTQTAHSLTHCSYHFGFQTWATVLAGNQSSWFSSNICFWRERQQGKKSKVTSEILEPTRSGRGCWPMSSSSPFPAEGKLLVWEQLLTWAASLESPAPLVDLVSCSPSPSSLFTFSVW